MALTADVVQNAYLAYFGRPADPVGLNYWMAQSDAAVMKAGFAASVEYATLYAGMTTVQQVSQVYTNMLGRAADVTGLLYWAGEITAGRETVSSLVDSMQANVLGVDVATVANRLTYATAFTTEVGLTAAGIVGYSGTAAADAARTAVTAVVDTAASLTTATTALATSVATVVGAGTSSTGTTFTLTVGADNFTGTSGNDTFVGATTTGDTWTVGDAINGGAGTDTFNVTQTAAITIPTGATVTNIETANMLSGTSGTSLNTTSWTGLTALNITAPGAVTATAAATTDITITDATQAASAISVNGGKAVAVTGSTSVASTGVGGTVTVGATTAAAGAVTVTENVTSTNVTGGTAATGGAIAVTGGTAVTVNQNISGASVATATVTVNAVGGAVTVTGDASTTAVTVNQTAAVVAVSSGTVGKHGIKDGDVTIDDENALSTTAAGTITTATLKNYGDSTIDSNALTTVNLEGTGGTLGITTNSLTTAANTALALNVNGLSFKNAAGGTNAITVDTDVETLNITSSTAASTVNNITAAGATAVNVAGDAALTMTTNTFGAATAITVTNTAGATFGTTAIAAGTLFTGGAGADSIILSNSFTKAITMGAGNDTVTVGGTTIGTGGSVAAGDGTDTIKMSSAQAATFDNNATFNTKFTGFEVLQLSSALSGTLDLAGLNAVPKVVLDAGGDHASTAILSNLATGGTVETKASSTGITVNVTNAVFNDADTLNLSVKAAAIATTGTFTAAGVETLNISLADATAAGGAAVKHVISTLTAADATTINVSGNNGLTISAATGSTKVASFDASGVVANGTAVVDTAANLAVTYTSLNTTTAATITGGAGDDVLTAAAASTFAQTITGGEGADTITGGAGNDSIILTETTAAADTVVFFTAASNGVDTITGFAAGTAGADIVSLLNTTTQATTGGAAVFATSTNTTLTVGAAAFALTGASSTTSDVVEITATLSSYGNLGLSGATSGTELLKALSSTDAAATSITATTSGDDFYVVAYQSGNAYLYQVTNDANIVVLASEIALIGVFNGVAAGAFATGDFTMQ